MNLLPSTPKADPHDLKVVLFHVVLATAQLILIGLKVEHPETAVYVTPVAEYLRRLFY